MKRMIPLLLSALCVVTISGCSVPELIEERFFKQNVERTALLGERSYMDEITGTIANFDGSTLTLKTEAATLSFDISNCTIETKEGMITGDRVSLIYEGQLSDADASEFRALKVADEIHKHELLKEQTIHGTVESISSNVLTLRTEEGQLIRWPITGVRQSYSAGISPGSGVYLTYKGTLLSDSASEESTDASHVKVLSISDTSAKSIQMPQGSSGRFRGHITSYKDQILRVHPNGASSVVSIDLTQVPCTFDGGTAPRSGVTVYYTGTFDGESLDGISVQSIIGDDFSEIDSHKITSTLQGVIIAHTADTISLNTTDGAFVTCTAPDVTDSSSGSLEPGSSVRVTFDPEASRNTNVLVSLSISDE